MKIYFCLLIMMLCAGCANMDFNHNGRGKFYINSEVLPMITNDKSFGKNDQTTQRIMVDKKIEYQYIHRF